MEHGNTGNNKEVGIDDLTLLCIEVSHSGEGDKSNLSSLMFLLRELDVSGQSQMEMSSASDEGKVSGVKVMKGCMQWDSTISFL